MATIKDVAELAGVSTGTVSNYLQGTHPVSLKKQKAIIDAMIALKYESNASARMLRSKRSNTIGLIVPNISDPYYTHILQGVQNNVTANAYMLYLAITENDPATETREITEMLSNQVSGLIIVTCQPDYTEFFRDRLVQNKIPVVFLERRITNLAATFLCCNNRKEMYELVQKQIKDGRRKIAFLSSSMKFSDQADAMEGYCEALKENGIAFDDELISHTVEDKETAFSEMLRLLPQKEPDGVVVTSELAALGVQEALRIFNRSCPSQVAVSALGVENWDHNPRYAELYVSPRRAISLGIEAATLLFHQINNPRTSEITSRVISKEKPQTSGSAVQYLPSNDTLRVSLVRMTPAKALLQMIPAYEQAAGVTVQAEYIDHSEYFNVLSRSFHDHTAADVVLVDMPWLPIFASRGALTDFSPYIENRGIDTSIYINGCMENLCQYQGRIYGLPLVYTPQVLFYRRDLFGDQRIRNTYEQKTGRKLRPPRTWSEFNTIAEFFTRRYNPSSPTKYGVSVACKYPECMSAEIRMRMHSFGGAIVDKNGKVVFESQENLNAFSQLISTFAFCPHDYRAKEREDIVHDFVGGKAAMIINFHPILNEVHQANVRHYLGVEQVPGFQSILGGWCMCVPDCSERKDAAMQFVQWASSMDVSSHMMVLSSQSVVSSVLDNDELHLRNKWFRSWRESYQTAIPFQSLTLKDNQIVSTDDLDWVLFQVVRKVIDDNCSLADAIHWGHNEFVALLEGLESHDNRWRERL